jgi:hypothetical protein
VLADGKTVLVSTFSCGLVQMTGLDSHAPFASSSTASAAVVALPVVVGNYWVRPCPTSTPGRADITRSLKPREVNRLALGDDFKPHWFRRAGWKPDRDDRLWPQVMLFSIDLGRKLSIIELPRPGRELPGVSFNHRTGRGASGNAVPTARFSAGRDGNRERRRAAGRRSFQAGVGPQALNGGNAINPMLLHVCARSAGR